MKCENVRHALLVDDDIIITSLPDTTKLNDRSARHPSSSTVCKIVVERQPGDRTRHL